MDGPTEAEIRMCAALGVAVLALELIATDFPEPKRTAALALEHLAEKYGFTPENT